MDSTTDSSSNGGSRRAGRIAWLVAGAIVALTLVVAVVGSLTPVCSLCHKSQAAAMAETGHDDMRCYGCHLDNGLWGLAGEKTLEFTRMYPLAVVGAGLTNPATPTSRTECLGCHPTVLTQVTSSEGIRVKHLTCAPGPTCDGCHSATAHGSAIRWTQDAVMEDCVRCHQQKGAPTECETCHTGEEGERLRTRGPWQITHGKDWQKTHGMGDLNSCSTCHPVDFCSKCHGVPVPHTRDFGATHGTAALEDPLSCKVCHKSEKDFCGACHGMPMPHPADFLPRHSLIANGYSDPSCIRCHVESDCETCHAYHVHPGGSTGVPVPWVYTPEGRRP